LSLPGGGFPLVVKGKKCSGAELQSRSTNRAESLLVVGPSSSISSTPCFQSCLSSKSSSAAKFRKPVGWENEISLVVRQPSYSAALVLSVLDVSELHEPGFWFIAPSCVLSLVEVRHCHSPIPPSLRGPPVLTIRRITFIQLDVLLAVHMIHCANLDATRTFGVNHHVFLDL